MKKASPHLFWKSGRELVKRILPLPSVRRLGTGQPSPKHPSVSPVSGGEQRLRIDHHYVEQFLSTHKRVLGFDQGLCVDRYYIEQFLSVHASDICGHVLEIGEGTYTCRFGSDRVAKSDVLHVVGGNPDATIVADLTCAEHIASDIFDCIILTQTLQYIYDVRAAVGTLHRILKPSGLLLATFPGIGHISRYDMEHWGEFWRFTTLSTKQLFEEFFLPGNVEVRAYGNMLTAIAFLQGLAAEEFKQEELDYHDPDFQLLLTARATKPKVTK